MSVESGGNGNENLGGFFQALVAHQLHQDSLMWSRVQTLIVIQGFVFAAGYSARNTFISSLVALAGFILTIFLYFIFERNAGNRFIHSELMIALEEEMLPDSKNEKIKNIRKENGRLYYLSKAWDTKKKFSVKIMKVILVGFGIVDGILIFVFPSWCKMRFFEKGLTGIEAIILLLIVMFFLVFGIYAGKGNEKEDMDRD